MQNKKFKKIVVAITIFSMMAIYGSVPGVSAANFTDTKDTLSSSAPSVSATHTITFTNNIPVENTGYVLVTLQGGATFGAISGGTCAGNATSTPTAQSFKCVFNSGIATTTANTVTVTAPNPATVNSYDVNVETFSSGDVLIEHAGVKVAIVDSVTMSATVAATLTFTVAPTSSDVTINGITTTATSTATTTAFGTIVSGQKYSVGQDLSVVTNADGGYVVTVLEGQDMVNGAGATIDSFIEGSSTSTPTTWAAPSGVLDQINTYGHMGVSTNDDIAGFGSNQYIGVSTSTARTIMSHNGPADGTTAQKGKASVVYSVEISSLQEAGDYSNTLTYVCTPTY